MNGGPETEENKFLVQNFIADGFQNGETDRLAVYISTDTYIQHSPNIADSIDRLQTSLAGQPRKVSR